MSRLTHANETKNATHTIIFLNIILVILKSFPFPTSIIVQLFLCLVLNPEMAVGFIPCEQRFLSCMAFSVYKVVRVACLSRSSNPGGGDSAYESGGDARRLA